MIAAKPPSSVPAVAPSQLRTNGRGPLRICHVAYTFYETDNRVKRYADAMVASGNSVDVLALRRRGQSRATEAGGVRLHRIQRRTVSEKAAWIYLAKIVWFLVRSAFYLTVKHVRKPYDVVHVHNVPDFLVFAAIVPKLLGAKVILDIHDILPELYAGKFRSSRDSHTFRALMILERLCCRFANHVVVANHIWHERLVNRAVPAENCTTILNYPDLDTFRPLSSRSELDDGKFVMLYPGTLNHHQGVDVAIKALALIYDRIPTAELHIYGEGPARDHLLDLARRSGISRRVKLMDPVSLNEIARVMAAAQLGIEPKRAEGFSNEALSTKILEFMACGVPVLVSRTQVHGYYFNDTVVRFFAPGDEHDLARAILETYGKYAERNAWTSRAKEFAAAYSWQVHMRDYYDLINTLCGAQVRTREELAG